MFIYKAIVEQNGFKRGQYYRFGMIEGGRIYLNPCTEEGRYQGASTIIVSSSKMLDLVQKGCLIKRS